MSSGISGEEITGANTCRNPNVYPNRNKRILAELVYKEVLANCHHFDLCDGDGSEFERAADRSKLILPLNHIMRNIFI